MPVYKETPDEILGILNVKSLLPFLDEGSGFNWQSLIYPPYYVPENKPIDDLLNELQQKRLHMVIVVDEFGGTSGLVTLEDLLEEVFGELNDEFDEISPEYQKFGENTYVFDGKTLVIDFLREMDLPVDYFTDKDYGADSLAGLITEEIGRIPKRGESAEINGLKFRVEAADLKKVKKVRVILPENREEMTSEEN
jgi:CBS domain containing-hemolysin-like protein